MGGLSGYGGGGFGGGIGQGAFNGIGQSLSRSFGGAGYGPMQPLFGR
jgi:hypothetical protein